MIVPAVGTEVDTAAIASEGNDGQWLSYGRNYSEQQMREIVISLGAGENQTLVIASPKKTLRLQ